MNLQVGNKFSFAEDEVKATHLSSPFGGGSLGYQISYEAFKTELLGESIVIKKVDVLEVVKAYQSVSGWLVIAALNGHEIHFLQSDATINPVT
jgi:hypothetical protein